MRKSQILLSYAYKFKTERLFESVAKNEPILEYSDGSSERLDLETKIKEHISRIAEVPICIGNEEIRTDDIHFQNYPFDHKKHLAKFFYGNETIIKKAIKVGLEARERWEKTPLEERAKIFLKAAEMIGKTRRSDLVATTMLGQAKTIFQAEIDAAAELIDFIRFNTQTAAQLMKYKPLNSEGAENILRWRGMEGFWAAISPFNFTAIGGNLSLAPALMGNVVLWKPTDTAILSNYTFYKILQECGLPPGVINFIPSDGPLFGRTITKNSNLAGINFTGSVATFRTLVEMVGKNIVEYNSFPRLIGECGGKNFHFVHETADLDAVSLSTVKSAFEYGGQKCSACSRLYVPESKWQTLKEKIVAILDQVKVDSPLVKDTFYSAVIDEKAFVRIESYIKYATENKDLTIEYGGKCDKSRGYFVFPTIIRTTDPHSKLMKEEIFGPLLTVYVYQDSLLDQTLELVDSTTPYALTGAIFSQDTKFIDYATEKLKNASGNFYINVQSTGSVVGQQPFGGSRLSGTNDKAGGPHYILKFTSPQSIKNQVGPIPSWKQSHMM